MQITAVCSVLVRGGDAILILLGHSFSSISIKNIYLYREIKLKFSGGGSGFGKLNNSIFN